mmetsp:Transcript_12507/g.12925  ORF Transcript_12507/g.12925 Transcript_12507/m.12925 type:complete len:192 (+) Transcript_12507:56-631(+)
MREKGWMKKMKSRGFEDHTKRMEEMKPLVDCKPPRKAGVSKRKEIERRRQYAAIELDNRLILERLAKVMQHKTIDNDPPHAKAIGRQQARRLELQRVTQENQRLLKRIQETEPCYNHLKWEEEAKKRAIYIRNMSEFQDNNNNNNNSTRLRPIIRNKSATTRRDESNPNLLSNGERLRPISAPRSRIPYNE